MHHVEQILVVNRPVGMVYNQWTQFETFPLFMGDVIYVRQVDASHLQWKARVAGRTKEWKAEITEQEPDRRISWRSVTGTHNAGTVRFRPLGKDRTEVALVIAYETEDAIERLGDAVFSPVRSSVKECLEDFKVFAESQSEETGAWRGEVVDGEAHERPIVHRSIGWPLLN